MSQSYNVWICVTEHNPDRVEAIKAAADKEWDSFDSWCSLKDDAGMSTELTAGGDGELHSTEQQLASLLARTVMQANGGPCQVETEFTLLAATKPCVKGLPQGGSRVV